MIIQKNTFDNCTIVCAIHQTVLQYTSIIPVEGENSYDKLKENILAWINETNVTQVINNTNNILFRYIN